MADYSKWPALEGVPGKGQTIAFKVLHSSLQVPASLLP